MSLKRPLLQRWRGGGDPPRPLFRTTEAMVGPASFARFGTALPRTGGGGWMMNVPVVGCAKRKGRGTPVLPGCQRDDFVLWQKFFLYSLGLSFASVC